MNKILIAYDGSPGAESALDDLLNAGLPAELNAAVISVAEVWLPSGPDQPEPIFPNTLSESVRKARARAIQELEKSKALANRACERLKGLFPKWKLQATACADSPAWGVVQKANSWHPDLVVLGSHGRSALQRVFLGSVAQKVAAESHCSVRIARPRQQPHHMRLRLMLAADGSSDSQAAVRAVAARSWPEYTECRVLTVIDAGLHTAIALSKDYAAQWVEHHNQEVKESISGMVEQAAAVLKQAGLKVEAQTYEGDPKGVLLREAQTWDVDCLFLGARGLNHGERLYLGTLASAVAGRAHCSVEIVRPNPAIRVD